MNPRKRLFWGSHGAFFFLFLPIFLTHLGLAAEANSFLNGAPTVLNYFDQTVNKVFKERGILKEDLVKIKAGGEFRYRLELRDNFNFNRATHEDDAVDLFRTRLNLSLAVGPYLRFFAEGQDAESVAESRFNRTAAFVNQLDLHQLYVELKSPIWQIPLTVKVGRQELSYGDQRFVGAFDWSNVARVFDAVKLVYQPKDWFQADLWFSQVVLINRNQPDSADHSDNFYGLYTTLKPVTDHVFDSFLFIRHNLNHEIAGEKLGKHGQLKEYTVGNRFKGKKWNFDYGLEWVFQFGSRAHEDIRAWAWHNDLGYTFAKIPWAPRIHFEYNHASGDSNPTDGKVETFDNLFPTNHDKYGFIDFLSLKNMHDLKIGAGIKPHQKLSLGADYHWFFLDTNNSPWFNAGQGVVRPANPAASTTLGQELDILLKWKLSEHLDFLIGYSRFFSGPFVEDTGAHDDANFFYTQIGFKV